MRGTADPPCRAYLWPAAAESGSVSAESASSGVNDWMSESTFTAPGARAVSAGATVPTPRRVIIATSGGLP